MLLLRVIRLRYLLRFTGVDITFVIGYLLKARNTTSQREKFKDKEETVTVSKRPTF